MPRGKRNEVYWAAHGDLVIRKGGGHFGHRSPRLMYPHVTRFRDHLLLLLFTASLLIAVLAQRKFPCGLLSCTYPSLHGTVLAENCLNQDTGGEITAHLLSISLFPSLTSSSKSSVAQEIFKKQAYYSSSASFTSTRPPKAPQCSHPLQDKYLSCFWLKSNSDSTSYSREPAETSTIPYLTSLSSFIPVTSPHIHHWAT